MLLVALGYLLSDTMQCDGTSASCIPKPQLKEINMLLVALGYLLSDTMKIFWLQIFWHYENIPNLVFLLMTCGALSSTVVPLGTCKTSQPFATWTDVNRKIPEANQKIYKY